MEHLAQSTTLQIITKPKTLFLHDAVINFS